MYRLNHNVNTNILALLALILQLPEVYETAALH